MNVSFDPSLIKEYASQLYIEAKGVIIREVLTYAFIGVITGGGLWYILVIIAKNSDPAKSPSLEKLYLSIFTGILLFGLFGYSHGKTESFRLKLEAQRILCQLETVDELKKIAAAFQDRKTG